MRRWSVRTRILLSFGLIILVLIMIAGLAAYQFSLIREDAAVVKDRSVIAVYWIGRLHANMGDQYATVVEIVLTQDHSAKQKLSSALETHRREAEPMFKELSSTNFTDLGRAHYNRFVAAYDDFARELAGVPQLASPPPTEAIEGPTSPAYVHLKSRIEPSYERLLEAVRTLDDFKKNQAVSRTTSVISSVEKLETAALIAFILALLISAVAATVLTRVVTLPLKNIVKAAQVMSTGDFTRRVDLTASDEFGQLGTSFNQMSEHLGALVGQVQKSTLLVTSSAADLGANARLNETTATEIASSTQEIGATSKEISSTSKELLRSVSEVLSVAEETAELGNSGQAGLSRMEENMRAVMEASSSIGDKLATLNEKAANINQVVTTISKVADQTNLLSLNAAIEAEKAGEFGRGFSVVADEIRRLADQTAIATEDIEGMVKEMQSAVSAGVMGMDKFSEEVRRAVKEVREVSEQLSQIIQRVQALTPRFEAVTEGMEAQTKGAEGISESMAELSKSARQTADSLRETNRIAEQLTDAANGLRTGVARFKL